MGNASSFKSQKHIGVRTYYITDVIEEDAGDGNVRVWNCERVNGVIVPRCEVIIHSSKLLIAGRRVAEFAQRISTTETQRAGDKVH